MLDTARFLEVDAGVRYWEDAYINGMEDAEGKIPLRNGDRWQPVIELSTGAVLNWPEGIAANIHYKVCDEGEYWLRDGNGQRIAKWKDYYVPNNLLCIGDNGFGDYIILKIGGDGKVIGWVSQRPSPDDWAEVE